MERVLRTFTKPIAFMWCCALLTVIGLPTFAQQSADPHFDTRVEKPTFTKNFPRVLFDEAHYNFDTTNNRYKPFADLLFNDGYHIAVNRQQFTKTSLATHKILVIVNPLGGEDMDDEGADGPAFTLDECEVVSNWVRGGGALLFIADHAPFASAAEILAKQLGVDMSRSETTDAANADKEFNLPSVIVYSRENHQLAESAITNGRSDAERVNRVIVFSGQSLKGPQGSEAFLKLADGSADVLNWQTLYFCRRAGGRWKIAGFLRLLTAEATSLTTNTAPARTFLTAPEQRSGLGGDAGLAF